MTTTDNEPGFAAGEQAPAPQPGTASEAHATPSDETGADASTGEAWREVMVQIDALGDAVSAWAHKAVNDPENRRHAAEIRSKLDSVASRVAETVDRATKTEVGSTVAESAEKTGQAFVDAGEKVAEAAAPHVATALTGLAGMLGKAAERVGRAVEGPAETATPPASASNAADSDAEDSGTPS